MFFKLFIYFSLIPSLGFASNCHYTKHVFNVKRKQLNSPVFISKNKNNLLQMEKDPQTGCSICEEDQEEITLLNGLKFKICRYLASKIEQGLNELLIAGVEIKSVEGYVVKQTAGDIDLFGNRTKLSQHAFGISIDINREHNGLYNNCLEWSENCDLAHGGIWNPQSDLSITLNSQLYQKMKSLGLKWGGEIESHQKDFMHFSPTGF